MGRGLIHIIKEKLQKSKIEKENTEEIVKEKENKKSNFSFNQINKTADSILTSAEPKVYTLAKENNIACKYKENFIITKDGNVCIGVELKGTSYAGTSLDDEIDFLTSRVMFFTTLKNDIEINIVIDKQIEPKQEKIDRKNINEYAKEIIEKWESEQEIYKIRYFLIISTITKNISGTLESFKTKVTSEENEEKEKASMLIKQKMQLLEDTLANLKNHLGAYKPRQMSADEIINFYATYSNAKETNLQYSNSLISDCYISSDVEFKKDYIQFYRNDGTTKYARFISVKAYETEQVKSLITQNLIKNNNEFKIFIYLKPYEKRKAVKKIKDTRAFAVEMVREELDELIELIQADRENLVETSVSVYCLADTLDELETKTNELKNILENQGLNVVRETLNLKALYFSFFPSRGNLNARKKTLNISNLATIANFENEVRGFNHNDWCDDEKKQNEAVVTFKHLNGTPFLFNFHHQPYGDRPSGHTMIIGGTGSGKTTITQFLMTNLFKYKINIFAMDKLRGMYSFTNFHNGKYYDSENKEFKLNPFSLADSDENREFLIMWLKLMANITEEEHQAEKDIVDTINRIYDTKQENQILKLSDFIESLPSDDESKLKTRFKIYENSIFDNHEDALNFTNQLSVLNMDGIMSDKKKAGLTAIYIFHKLKNEAKNDTQKRGFFCFIDELKDYLNDATMQEKILEAILEVRKIGGVMCLGFQSISLFNTIERGSSFLENIANFVIFPTNNEDTLNDLEKQIGITATERKYLKETSQESRQALLKMKLRNESAKLNLDLSRLGKYLKIYSSNSENVNVIKQLQKEAPKNWRKAYLDYKEPKKD